MRQLEPDDRYDCGAPYNEIEVKDEDGNEITICDCRHCRKNRKFRDYEPPDHDDDRSYRRGLL